MTAAKVCLVLFALVAVSLARSPWERDSGLSGLLRKVLESLRPSLKDLAIPNQNLSINIPQAQISFTFDDGIVRNLDQFAIDKVTTSLIPLKLTNLTLTLDQVTITGRYNLSGEVGFSDQGNPTVYGNGPAKIELKGIFFTIASKFILVEGKVQIPPNGLYGFDVYLHRSKVELKNLMGGGDKGDAVNQFFSFFIPDLVRDYKFFAFEELREPIRLAINGYLAG